MQIWPAIDIRAGKCVRLVQGDYQKETVYGDSPADMALRWISDGAECLHIVDLDGARDGSPNNFEAICRIALETNVPLQIGGGIRDELTIKKYIDAGIERLVLGTQAIREPQWAIEMASKYPNRIVLGLDARNGWLVSDGHTETTNISCTEFAHRMAEHPIAGIIFTDIAMSGMLAGPNFEAHKQLRDSVNVPVLAAGGITKIDDVSKLAGLQLHGCIIGRALYEGRLTLADSLTASLEHTPGAMTP